MLYSNHPESLPKNSPKTQNHSFPPRFHWILTQTVTNMKHTKFQLIPIKLTALGGGVTVRFTQISLKVCPEIQTHSFPHWFTAPILRRLQTSNAPSFSSFQLKLQFWGVVGMCALVVLVQKCRKKSPKIQIHTFLHFLGIIYFEAPR